MKMTLKKAVAIALVVMLLCGIAPMRNIADFFSLKASAENETLAASGQCGDNAYWTFDDTTGRLTISGTGDMWDYDSTDSPFKNQDIYRINVEQGVTSVGNEAFYGCDANVVYLNDTVVTIGDRAFYGCDQLVLIYRDNGQATAFDLPSALTTIGDEAFCGCHILSRLNIPANVTGIGNLAFYQCWGMKQLTLNNGLVSIGEEAFRLCWDLTNVTIPDSVTSIGTKAFNECNRLTSYTVGANNQNYSSDANGVLYNKAKTVLVDYPDGRTDSSFTIPNTVTRIGEYAFAHSDMLSTVIIPNSVTSIGTEAFNNMSNLYSISIPDSVTEIEDGNFSDCLLSFITIPDSVTTFGDGLFMNDDSPIEGFTIMCDESSAAEQYAIDNNISYVYIDAEMQQCGENAYWILDSTTNKLIIVGSGEVSTYYDGETHTHPFRNNSVSFTTLFVDTGITGIGDDMFEMCWRLQKVILSDTVTSIGTDAFYDCEYLNELRLSKGLTSIGECAFGGCTRLSRVQLPNSLTVLGTNAFTRCINITSISIPGSVSTIGFGAFQGCKGIRTASIEEGVTTIGACAFDGCTKLHTFTIPSTVTMIGAEAFHNTDFTSAAIPASVTTIGQNAFGNCQYLSRITVDSQNQNYSSGSHGELLNKDQTQLIQWPSGKNSTSYTIPQSVTTVKSYAFDGAKYLKYVTIPSNVQAIEDNAFSNCAALTEATITNGLTSIGAYAFSFCNNFESITIPYTVQSIGNAAIPTKTKIYCYENTAAHQYAVANRLTYELLPYVSTDLLRSTNATVTISGSNITLTAIDAETQINLYPSLTNGNQLTFTNLTGSIGTSKNGTVFARNNATAVMTIEGLNVSYNVSFVFPQASIPVADNIRYANATASVSGSTITLNPTQGATQINVYPTLKDGTSVTFSNHTGGAGVSKNGTLYAKGNGTATMTVGSTDYSIVFDFGSQAVSIGDNIRYANATASVSSTTITLTPNQGATKINVYPTLNDGTSVTFSNRTGGAGVSKNGTLYAKGNGTATMTVGSTDYSIVFDFGSQAVSIGDNIRYANATASVSSTTITLTPNQGATQINVYPTLNDGTAITFSDRTGGAGVSKHGTLYAKSNGSATFTLNNVVYTVNFAFTQE